MSISHILNAGFPPYRSGKGMRFALTPFLIGLIVSSAGVYAQQEVPAVKSDAASVDTDESPDVTFASLMRSCWDLSHLAVAEPGVTCRQFSSYDRSGWKANRDWGNYLRSSEEEGNVCAEMEGPGSLVRFWSANPSGTLSIYLDGNETPALDIEMERFFRGEDFPFIDPLAYYVSGSDAYVPIPYQKSCKIVLRGNKPLYYHFGYKTYPKETRVKTYSQVVAEAAKRDVDEAITMLSDPGPDLVNLLHPPGSLETVTFSATAEPDRLLELFSRKGEGQIALFVLDGQCVEPHFLRTVLLRIYWDDAVKPAVDCPMGDFFGTAFGKNRYCALPMGMTEEGGYCLFPMPFEKGARIELLQQGSEPVRINGRVVLAPLPEERGDLLRFHAGWRRENPCLEFEYPVLKAAGLGKFVGCALFIHNPRERWWGEGDEKIWVDGEEFPSYFGTGTEDYFGDAWGHRYHIRPFEGCTLAQSPDFGNKTCVYRYHILDSVPFRSSFRMTLENYAEDVDYSSVAWWYSSEPGGNRFFKETPASQRIPQKPVAIGALEAEDLEIVPDDGSRVLKVDDANLPGELSKGNGMLLTGPGPFTIAFPSPVDGNFRVRLGLAAGIQHPVLELKAAEGVPMRTLDFPSRIPGFLDARDAAWVRLKKGENTVILRPVYSGEEIDSLKLLLDFIELEPVKRRPEAIEAEEMKILSYRGGKVSVEDFALPWSAGAQLRLIARDETAHLNLALPIDVEGFYIMTGRCTRTMGYGPFQISIDRKAPIRVIPNELKGDKLSDFELNRIYLTEGRHFIAVSTTTTVGLDCFEPAWSLGDEHVFEAESMVVLESEGGEVAIQNMDPAHCSKGKQLWFKGEKQQAFIELELPIALAGDYNIKVFYTKSWDYGEVQMYLNGRALGKHFDGYHPGTVPAGVFEVGRIHLEAENHRLKFALVGKNDQSVGYYMGIDAIKVDPL